MKLEELKMYPAPVSDAVFLGKIKSNIWIEKIDFTDQFWYCLAEICGKKLIESKDNSVVFVEVFSSGLKLEIKVSI